MKLETVAGKKVLVTGAAMGLGKLFAERAVREGAAAVVLWDINEPALKETAEGMTGRGTQIHTQVVDVSDREAIVAAAATTRETVGDIDVLVNNAGIVRGNTYFWETENVADIEKTMAINSLAPMYITLEFLPAMVRGTGQARVLTIASSAGLVSNPRMSVYAASKWAALGWSDSVRLELEQAGHDHVKVTTVCPTYIDTGMFDGEGHAAGGAAVDLAPEQGAVRPAAGEAARPVPGHGRRLSLDGSVHRAQEVTLSASR